MMMAGAVCQEPGGWSSPLAGDDEAVMDFLVRLTAAIDLREYDGRLHGESVALLSRHLARLAGYSEAFADDLRTVTPLHDLGKVAVPDAILLKPGPLNAEERRIVERHAEIGATILAPHGSTLLHLARQVALGHHEKWDGTGYPHRIAGTDIPLCARIVAIADVFDALLSRRPYKDPWPPEEVRHYMAAQSSMMFDPRLLALFLGDFERAVRLRAEAADLWLVD